MRQVSLLFALCLVGWLVLAAGCDGGYLPNEPAEAGSTSTGEGGTGGAAPVCTSGACVPSAGGPFVRVTMVSIGKPEEVRPCPSWAPLAFEGFAGMKVDAPTCPSCSCGPAACALPEEIHASAAKCANAEGAQSTPWDAPPAWEGGCFSEAPIAAGLECSGVPCVQSVTIDAPIVEPCKPTEQGEAHFPDPLWERMARECKIKVDVDGCGDGESCAPVPPEGFALCLSVAGEGYECPAEYPEHYLVFDSADDARACSPCACSDPEGADCAAFISIFTNSACGALLGTYMLANEEPGCFDLPSGSALGSKSASFVTDKPGACGQSGGEAVGELRPAGPVTFCCQPATGPAK